MVACLVLLLSASLGTAILPAPPDSVVSCLPCHNQPGNDPVGEWLVSPYSQAEGGRGCVDCHGRHCRRTGGSEARDRRDDDTGSPSPASPAAAVQLTVTAFCSGDGVEAEVVVTNLGAGHDLPTGPPERTLVLDVAARGPAGLPLLPRAKSGRSASGLARHGAPGRVFVKYLPDGNSEIYRSRLAPFETDVSRYRFVSPGRDAAQYTVEVNARLRLLPVSGSPVEIASTTTVCRTSSTAP